MLLSVVHAAMAVVAQATQQDARSLFDQLLMAGGAAAVSALAWLLTKVAAYFAAKVKSERWAGVISRVDDTAFRVVRDVEATYVAELEAANADGVITAEEKAAAKAKAMAALKSYLGKKGLSELAALLGADSLDGFLGASIEHALASHEVTKALAVPPSSPPQP